VTTRERPAHFERLATVGSVAVANVLAARLRAEGIEVRVHSAALGPYPVTVGELARSELWVLSDRMAEATEIMLDADTRNALAPAEPDYVEPRSGLPPEVRLLAIVVGVIVVVLVVARLLRVY
jgi:Putative prokaryotic signal transducing protein